MKSSTDRPTRPAATTGVVESSDGQPIGYTRLGEHGPPLVVCHGSFAVADDWLPFAHALATTNVVYLYDRRGRGESPLRDDEFAIDAEVHDLAAMMSLAGDDASVLGHSFGGGCALAYANSYQFSGTVILYEPRHAIDGPVSRGQIPRIRKMLAQAKAGVLDLNDVVRTVLTDVIGLEQEDVETMAGSPLWQRMKQTVHVFPDEVRLLDELTWAPGDLHGVHGPVWLLIGSQSPVLPADREGALRSVLASTQRVVVPGQGHFAYLSGVNVLAGTVRDCLQSAAVAAHSEPTVRSAPTPRSALTTQEASI